MKIYQLDKIKRNHNGHTLLEDISLSFEAGKIFALVGENGSGKTSLLETLALLEAPQAGSLRFYDQEIDFDDNLSLLRRKITFCMQRPLLFKTTAYNNIAYGLKLRGEKEIGSKIHKLGKILDLFSLLNKRPNELSGGEAQKVALARTFIIETPIVLLDEPTANLDEASIAKLESLMKAAQEKGAAIILSTHREDIASRLSDEIITIKDSRAYPLSSPNFFCGMIDGSLGLRTCKINEHFSVAVVTNKKGSVKISIDPRDIILSIKRFNSSARNCLAGKVSGIVDEGNSAKVTANCLGTKLVCQITHRSLHELGINVGRQVFLTFKTSSIKVY